MHLSDVQNKPLTPKGRNNVRSMFTFLIFKNKAMCQGMIRLHLLTYTMIIHYAYDNTTLSTLNKKLCTNEPFETIGTRSQSTKLKVDI